MPEAERSDDLSQLRTLLGTLGLTEAQFLKKILQGGSLAGDCTACEFRCTSCMNGCNSGPTKFEAIDWLIRWPDFIDHIVQSAGSRKG